SGVYAAPLVSEVSVKDSQLKQGGTLIIRGSGVGFKEQAAPILVDYVEQVYENGKLRDVYSGYRDGQSIKPTSEDPAGVWAAVTGGDSVRYDRSGSQRHSFDVARYHLVGEDAWFGRPSAYGGMGGWDTPTDNSQLYLSWWVKVDYNSSYYWRINP